MPREPAGQTASFFASLRDDPHEYTGAFAARSCSKQPDRQASKKPMTTPDRASSTHTMKLRSLYGRPGCKGSRLDEDEADMSDPADRVPKAYRNRLHRLKNAYRQAYRREPELDRAVTERAAIEAIDFLEDALRRAGVPLPEQRRADARFQETPIAVTVHHCEARAPSSSRPAARRPRCFRGLAGD
jgi:hypothetical protein